MIAVAVLGFALAAAPLAFQMFSRAPAGGDMIDDFRPYMTTEEIENFRGYMREIRAADEESRTVLEPALAEAGIGAGDFGDRFVLVTTWNEQWPAIDADMIDLLDTMDANLGNFEAVDALPPFALFPWFFVIPGLLAGILAIVALRARDTGTRRTVGWVLAGLGLAVIVAPLVFQMFTRAPKGADMIDDFRPMMVRERVQNVQGYFVTLGGAEGQLRTGVVPLAATEAGLGEGDLPAIEQFSAEWPTIVGDFAPMVATMSDNVDNFEGVDALPPFDLFPWFFVIPGLLVATLAWRAQSDTTSTQPD